MLLLMAIMTIVPTIFLVYASLHQVDLLSDNSTFVGLQNFTDFLKDGNQRIALFRAFAFAAVVVVIELIIGMLLALALQKSTRRNNFYTVIVMMPFAVTPVVSAMIFRELLNPSFGWINYFLHLIGFPANTEWLAHTNTAWLAIIFLDIWQWTPFVALILIAGLQSIPLEPREAATIDGANDRQIFRLVTLPQLAPFITIAIVLRSIQAIKTFDSFSILTNGGPGTSTEIINLQIYRIALGSFQIGAAAAVAVIFLISLSLLVPLLIRAVGKNAKGSQA
jgi:multiple sugar transport system permease protein